MQNVVLKQKESQASASTRMIARLSARHGSLKAAATVNLFVSAAPDNGCHATPRLAMAEQVAREVWYDTTRHLAAWVASFRQSAVLGGKRTRLARRSTIRRSVLVALC